VRLPPKQNSRIKQKEHVEDGSALNQTHDGPEYRRERHDAHTQPLDIHAPAESEQSPEGVAGLAALGSVVWEQDLQARHTQAEPVLGLGAGADKVKGAPGQTPSQDNHDEDHDVDIHTMIVL